jgi:amino acid adenylation domain-containing protein
MNAALTQRLENLSPAKRVLLEMKLKGKTPSSKDPFSIQPQKNSGLAPLSFNQESLLFMERLNPNTSTYNVYEAVRLTGELNFAALQQTFDSVAARHEALRTTFAEIDGQPQQIVAPPQPVPIQVINLSQSPIEKRESEAFGILNNEVNQPLNLQQCPLFKATLIKLSERENLLLVMMHHIISDGWSIGVFWKEFTHFYKSFSQGKKPDLPKLPIQFGDYSAWAREQLEKDLIRQTEYWKQQLAGAPSLLELPTDRPRPAIQSPRGAQEISLFPANLRDELKKLSQQENATLFMTLLAAFNILLARYTGQEDLVVGSPIAGRNKTETENLIGYFVNTLALRNDLSGDPTFREILGRIKNTTLDAFSHQELPFEKIVAAVCPQRSLSYNPIFQVAFALQENSESLLKIPGLEICPVKLGSITSKFDLFLSAKESAGGLAVTVEYSTDLFEAATIQRLMRHYQNLLETLVANPNQRISEMSFLSDSELHQLLVEWNETTTEFPNKCLGELFEIQAEKNSEQIAIVTNEGDISYKQLNERSNKIAHHLRRLGARPNSPIGIFMERSALMTTGILGILKSGGAYLPMDSSYPQTRLQHMIEDADVKVILTTKEKLSQLPKTQAKAICLDTDWEIFAAESEENPANVNQPTDLAYVIYTSGSTGKPKGTLIPHRAVNRLVFNTNYVQIDSADRIAHISNVSFDAATFELWGTLLHGARLVILNKDLVLSPKEFISELQTQKITTMFLTTALFNLLARENPNAFQTLKTVMFGGEACDPAAVRRVLENNPPERLLHVYGPTETTTFATWHHIQTVAEGAQTIPIGRPISNTTAYLVDSNFNPVPAGVPGEIFIGGDGLAQGYLNRPELSEEKFVSVPASKISIFPQGENQAVKLYRTGDIARYLPDGSIEFIGRKDHQIKLRGFRIELGEIESAINSHPAIKDAVIALKENENEKKLVAYYVSVEGAAVSTADLREYLKQRLPDYMTPSIFFEVAELALNPNGKIDRHKLPSLEEISFETETEISSAKDELELKLTWIWQKVLGLQTIGVKDNFFELGGHSLLAVRLFSEIEKTFGCQLPLATLFKAPTIEQLAGLIREGGWQSTWGALVPLRPHGTKPPFFCVHAVGGNVLEYNDLANYLDSDQPFYGLQAIGLDGKSEPLTDVEEMAAAYLKEIRQIQPEGPYYLGGRSFGGTVAYEMARQLAEQGEKIALLAIFDSYPKGWLKLCSEEEAENYKKQFLKLRIKRHLENWKQLGMIGKAEYFLEKANYKTRKYKSLLWRLTQKIGVGTKQSVNTTIRDIEEINYLAIKKYVPKLYSGKVTFFSAREEVCPEENLTGWQRLAQGGVEVVEVPGDHQTMIKEPHVQDLAQALADSISQSTND